MSAVPRALTHVLTADPVVALTFDDGPDPIYTPRLLDVLARYRARATFFMIGARAQCQPDLVARVASEGHVIGNHSWDHPSFPLISRDEKRQPVLACAQAVSPPGAKLFRPPYGDLDFDSWLEINKMGYEVVAWRVDPHDWDDSPAPRIAQTVLRRLHPGAIVLLHDGLFDARESRFFPRGATISAVEILLNRLTGIVRFITIPDLLACGTPCYRPRAQVRLKGELNRLMRQDGPARCYL